MECGIYFRTPLDPVSGVPQHVRVLSSTFAHKKAQDFSWALMVVFGLPDFETSTDTEEFTELSKMFSLDRMSGEDHITFRSDKTGGG